MRMFAGRIKVIHDEPSTAHVIDRAVSLHPPTRSLSDAVARPEIDLTSALLYRMAGAISLLIDKVLGHLVAARRGRAARKRILDRHSATPIVNTNRACRAG